MDAPHTYRSCWMVHNSASMVSFGWFCSVTKVLTPYPLGFVPLDFHQHRQDQVYCLVPGAPSLGGCRLGQEFLAPLIMRASVRVLSRSQKGLVPHFILMGRWTNTILRKILTKFLVILMVSFWCIWNLHKWSDWRWYADRYLFQISEIRLKNILFVHNMFEPGKMNYLSTAEKLTIINMSEWIFTWEISKELCRDHWTLKWGCWKYN